MSSYPRIEVTVDCVIFGYDNEELRVLLIQRDLKPFQGRWALPGGFVNISETLDGAAMRELEEETGIRKVYLEQLYTFGDPGRDPRGRVVTVAYFALVNLIDHHLKAASDARSAAWFPIDDLPKLAFDHESVIQTALQRLRGKVRYQPIGFELLPGKFTLRHLQRLYETILDSPLDKRNFRKKILSMELLTELDEVEQDVTHRAAKLYRFNEKKYISLTKQGFEFSI
jgi:8-oxo-dGTP diphosphatase